MCVLLFGFLWSFGNTQDFNAYEKYNCDSSNVLCKYARIISESGTFLKDLDIKANCLTSEITLASNDFSKSVYSLPEMIISEVSNFLLENESLNYNTDIPKERRKSYLKRISDCVLLEGDELEKIVQNIGNTNDQSSKISSSVSGRSGGYGGYGGGGGYGGDSLHPFIILGTKIVTALVGYLGYVLYG